VNAYSSYRLPSSSANSCAISSTKALHRGIAKTLTGPRRGYVGEWCVQRRQFNIWEQGRGPPTLTVAGTGRALPGVLSLAWVGCPHCKRWFIGLEAQSRREVEEEVKAQGKSAPLGFKFCPACRRITEQNAFPHAEGREPFLDLEVVEERVE